jgi:hypothetical protein
MDNGENAAVVAVLVIVVAVILATVVVHFGLIVLRYV